MSLTEITASQLQPALAGVRTQRDAERAGLYPSLELGDPLAVSLRFSMDRVLKRLYELLHMLESRLQSLQRDRVSLSQRLR